MSSKLHRCRSLEEARTLSAAAAERPGAQITVLVRTARTIPLERQETLKERFTRAVYVLRYGVVLNDIKHVFERTKK